MLKSILQEKGVSVLNSDQQKSIKGGRLSISDGVGNCVMTATNGMVVTVPGREGDAGYCDRLCDNAPGCASVEQE
jgi:hypothetical protein